MQSFMTRGRIITATVIIILLTAVFLAGVQHGYDIGFADGEDRANGWWIDKKSRYYESAEIKKKRLTLNHNAI